MQIAMRMSKLFVKTLREKPAEAELVSHELMLRAGLVSKLAAGIYDYLPLAWRSVKKIEDIMRQEMDAIDGQEINMPVVNPSDIWEESGRWFDIGSEMVRFKDRSGRFMCLAMTHEEPVTDLARKYIDSHRQLPCVLYHIQTKFRDEPRSRGGLVRVREFIMKDAYSFHVDEEDLKRYYPKMCRAYKRICKRCGVPVVQVQSDVGMMGGSRAHEFTYVTSVGEDTLILCTSCGYAANREVAKFQKEVASPSSEFPGGLEKVYTPGTGTIDAVCAYLSKKSIESIKTLVYVAEGQDKPYIVVIRGDLDVNERKLANLVKTSEVRMATGEELERFGLVEGFMSPVGLEGFKVVSDDSLKEGVSYVAGANEKDYHYTNVVPGRDYKAELVGDIASAREGDRCPVCGSPLSVKRGIEVGNTFMLGVKYSKPMGAYYKDPSGTERPIVMGCYGMGVGRLLACILEENHDDRGIIWPVTVAPFQVHIVELGASEEVREAAEKLYRELTAEGFEVLYDDRDESAGVKFNDADLLGMPVRVTVSARSLKAGGFEVKLRRESSGKIVPAADAITAVKDLIAQEEARFAPEEGV